MHNIKAEQIVVKCVISPRRQLPRLQSAVTNTRNN